MPQKQAPESSNSLVFVSEQDFIARISEYPKDAKHGYTLGEHYRYHEQNSPGTFRWLQAIYKLIENGSFTILDIKQAHTKLYNLYDLLVGKLTGVTDGGYTTTADAQRMITLFLNGICKRAKVSNEVELSDLGYAFAIIIDMNKNKVDIAKVIGLLKNDAIAGQLAGILALKEYI